MVDECTSCHKQAITTLRSGEVVENHMEERKEEQKEEQIEAPLDLYWEKGKEVSTMTSSPSRLIPETPCEPRAPIPGNLKISFLDIDDILPVISSYDLPRGQENRLLGLLEEQKETIEVGILLQFMIPYRMRNCLGILKGIYLNMRKFEITYL
jgi:hypothetical protein